MFHDGIRRIRALGLSTLVFLWLAFSPGLAASPGRVVRVGVYQNEPKVFIDESGHASGIFIELLEAMASQEGWKLVYVPCEWAQCLSALEGGQIDLMPDVAYSAERDQKYAFHKISVLKSWSRVYTSPRVHVSKITDLDGKRVAVLQGSIQQTVFEQLMSGFGNKVTILPVQSLNQAFALVAEGSADAAVANHLFGDYYYLDYKLVKTEFDFNPSSLYYASADGRNQDLLDRIDRHLSAWFQQSNSAYDTIIDRWIKEEPVSVVPQYIFWIVGGILGLLTAATGLILLLRRQVRARTQKLELANLELQESEGRYRTLASISPVGIFRTDRNGSTTYVNPKWCEISGLSAEQAMGDGWIDAVYHDDRQSVSRNWQKAADLQQSSVSTYRFLRPDGKIAWVMGQAVPETNARQEIIGYMGTITDITERMNAETELRRLNSELEERVARRTEELSVAVRQAQESDRLKSAFLATMSHELRTPLNSIIGFTGVLLQGLAGPLNVEQMKQLNMVRDSSRHLLALINDVLDISKIEAGQLEMAHASFDMRAVIEAVLSSVAPQAQKKGLMLGAAIAFNVGILVSDRRRVEQILLNLLSNAIKFTEQGEVRLECQVQGTQLITRVSDTGMGIRPQDLNRLFEPFHQLESGLNRRHEGTGLGLAICKNLANLLGGQIYVESQWGVGSTFTFTLPLPEEGASDGKHSDH